MATLSNIEKKMDMSLDDIIKASTKKVGKPAGKPKGAGGAQPAAKGKQGVAVRKAGGRGVTVKKTPISVAKPIGVTKRGGGAPKALGTSLTKPRVGVAKTTMKRTGTTKQSMAQKIVSKARGLKQAPKVLSKKTPAAPKQAPKLLPKQQQTRQQRQPIQFNGRQTAQQPKSMAQTMNKQRRARAGVPVRQQGQSPAIRVRAPVQGGRGQVVMGGGGGGRRALAPPQQAIRRTQQGRVRKPAQPVRAPIMQTRQQQPQQARRQFNNRAPINNGNYNNGNYNNGNYNNGNYNNGNFNSRAPVRGGQGNMRRGGPVANMPPPRRQAGPPRNMPRQQQAQYAAPRAPRSLAPPYNPNSLVMVDGDELDTLAQRQHVHAMKIVELQKLEDAMNRAERRQHIFKMQQSVGGGSVRQAQAKMATGGGAGGGGGGYDGYASPAGQGGAGGYRSNPPRTGDYQQGWQDGYDY